jgi:lipid-binding SYLF domain-containing protein
MQEESPERHAILTKECTDAETIWREIVRLEGSRDESPMKPWIINNAHLVMIYSMHKTSCFFGSSRGTGIVIARLRTSHHALVQWSAPLFINISASSLGFSFGKQNTCTFAVASAVTAKNKFTKPSGRHFKGLDFNFTAGTGLQERSDVVSTNMTDDIGFLGVSKVGGVALDLSFFVTGAMKVDLDKCKTVYGNAATPAEILSMPGPAEFQPLYGELGRVVNTVERQSPFNPGRVSASLERFSSGIDPERTMVMPDGGFVRQDLKAPPKE